MTFGASCDLHCMRFRATLQSNGKTATGIRVPPEVVAALAREHGLEMGNAPWLEDVIARYDLTPPPGS